MKQVASDQQLLTNIEVAIDWLSQALAVQCPVLVAGNGGSASDAMHISGELVGRFTKPRRALNVICLNSNASILTAWSNDTNFEDVFARQIEAHSPETGGGIFWGLSTSGNSKNILRALEVAQKRQMKTIMLTGEDGGGARSRCDLLINVPSSETPRVQEIHLSVYHYICQRIEERLI